jgi:hypothetical protein
MFSDITLKQKLRERFGTPESKIINANVDQLVKFLKEYGTIPEA